MFAALPLEIIADRRLTLIDLRTAAALYSFASATSPVCWPSRRAIGERCGYSVETISRAVSRLRRFGWITDIRRRKGSSVYTLKMSDPGTSTCDRSGHPEQTREQTTSPPTPEKSVETTPAPTPAPTPTPTPTPAPAPAPEPALTADDVVQVAILAHFHQITGINCDTPRHRRAVRRALANHSADQIKRAASHCAATWSNAAWATPAAVLKPGRVAESLAQAQATAAPKAAAHRLFQREPEPPRSAPDSARQGLSALRTALGAAA